MKTTLYQVQKLNLRGEWVNTPGKLFCTKSEAEQSAAELSRKWPKRRWGVRRLEMGELVSFIEARS